MRLWLSRGCIAIVFLANVQCAVAFILSPVTFTSSYELSGVVGTATIQAIGVLFLMWNIPYAVALWHPLRHRLSLWEAVAMQAIGVIGESIIKVTLPGSHQVLHSSLERFIWFDGLGVLLLLLAVWFSRSEHKQVRGEPSNRKQ
jgi:hypothetical protein